MTYYHGVNTLWFECDIAFHWSVALARALEPLEFGLKISVYRLQPVVFG